VPEAQQALCTISSWNQPLLVPDFWARPMNQNYELLIVHTEDTKTLFPLERVFFFLLQRVGRFVLKKRCTCYSSFKRRSLIVLSEMKLILILSSIITTLDKETQEHVELVHKVLTVGTKLLE